MFNRRTLTAVLVLWCAGVTIAFAAEPITRIDVKGMHCVMCAKKISTKVQTMPGIASAVADSKTGVVTVTTKPNASVSPKSLWEVIEAAGYKPVRLAGPSGTFEAKPKK